MSDPLTVFLDALADLPPMGAWVSDAACRGQGDVFTEYPQRRATAELVEQTCQRCPVRGACLAFADKHRVDGVWAGEWHSPSTGEVKSLSQRPTKAAAACGTPGGYRRHLRLQTVACDPCRAANSAEARRVKAAKRTAA